MTLMILAERFKPKSNSLQDHANYVKPHSQGHASR
jgi:hypothetical protein